MIINVLNRKFDMVDIIDDARSVIWSKRYWEPGDFEIYMIANEKNVKRIKEGYFLSRDDDNTIMIIETIKIKTDIEDGNYMTVSGRSLEIILEKRCAWNYQSALGWRDSSHIKNVFQEAWANISTDDYRGFGIRIVQSYAETLSVFNTSGTTYLYSWAFAAGGTLLEIMKKECRKVGVGFEFRLDKWDDGEKFLRFDAIIGEDRSESQAKNPQIFFSAEYNNLLNSNYEFSTEKYKNSAFIYGEGEGADRKREVIAPENISGFELNELYVDARDLSSKGENNTTISDEEYRKMLQERGKEKLAECFVTEKFEGEIAPYINFEYKKDYFIGDIITIKNEYGISQNVRITAVTECEDENGYHYVPVYEKAEEVQ